MKTLETLVDVTPNKFTPHRKYQINESDPRMGVNSNYGPELINGTSVTNIVDEYTDVVTTEVDDYRTPEEPEPDIPERMFIDSQVVGYPALQMQIDTYNMALMGNLPIVGPLTVTEVGAKRGDIARYISETLPLVNLTYIGYEPNDLLVAVSAELLKRENLSENCSVIHGDYLTTEEVATSDVTLVISNLIYSTQMTDGTKWIYIEQLLKKMIPHTLETIVLVLLHDNGGDDNYIAYPIPNMSDLLLKFNHPFKIDMGKLPDMYTVVIDTKTKRFL